MRLTISTFGTAGEIIPLVTLARRLAARGHAVRMALPSSAAVYARGAEFEVVHCRPDIGPNLLLRQAEAFSVPERRAHPDPALRLCEQRLEDLWPICAGSDALIAAWFPTVSALLREILGIPWIQAQPTAGTIFSPTHEQQFERLETGPESAGDPVFAGAIREWQSMRIKAGLGEPPASLDGYFRPDLLLAAVSRHAFPQAIPPTRPTPVFTGFWLERHADWQPDEQLAAFLERRPIVFSFSSQVTTDSKSVLNMHARAALRVGLPLLVLAGWSGLNHGDLDPDIPQDHVMIRSFEPLRRVAEQASCAVVHGGIGTIGDAVLAGCPMLVEPYAGDQFINAAQVLHLGIGAAGDHNLLTEESVARLFRERVLLPEVKRRATALAALVGAEDGPEKACQAVEEFLAA